MVSKIKVLELGPGDFGKSGLSVIAWNWYQKFDLEKICVDFLSCTVPDDSYVECIRRNGGEFYLIDVEGKNIIQRQSGRFFTSRKIAKENKYDCVHIHVSEAAEAFSFYTAVRPFCKKVIIHSHSSGVGCESSEFTLGAKIKLYIHKFCKKLIRSRNVVRLACSDLAGKWMYLPKYDYTIINNGIDMEKFVFNKQARDKIRSQLKIENKFVVGHIGRFSYQKNHDFLIEVFDEVYKKNTNAVLLLLGYGELEKQIREKIHILGLDNAVIFYGTASNANEFYQAMDCFVLPSHFEGLPVVAVEAQTAGLKFLCSDVVTKEAKITDLLEFMSLSDSAEAWAEKILSYDDGYERMDMSAEMKKAGFDIEYSAKQLEELYFS